ncbi:MAG: stage V sporulation protein AE [Oscillospiraceae bacterium]|nr:stage V sporulation protein AE [Oscillospiraceae bacterium]
MEVFWEYAKAFLVGGAICAVGQVLIDYTKLTPARILVTFVVLGVALGGLGVYQPLVEWAGGGASIPLTGWGNAIARGTREAVAEKGIYGVLSGGLTISAAGVAAAIFFGLMGALVFRPKEK